MFSSEAVPAIRLGDERRMMRTWRMGRKYVLFYSEAVPAIRLGDERGGGCDGSMFSSEAGFCLFFQTTISPPFFCREAASEVGHSLPNSLGKDP